MMSMSYCELLPDSTDFHAVIPAVPEGNGKHPSGSVMIHPWKQDGRHWTFGSPDTFRFLKFYGCWLEIFSGVRARHCDVIQRPLPF